MIMNKENVILIYHKTKVNRSQLKISIQMLQCINFFFSFFFQSNLFSYMYSINQMLFIFLTLMHPYLSNNKGNETKIAVNSFSKRKNPKWKKNCLINLISVTGYHNRQGHFIQILSINDSNAKKLVIDGCLFRFRSSKASTSYWVCSDSKGNRFVKSKKT